MSWQSFFDATNWVGGKIVGGFEWVVDKGAAAASYVGGGLQAAGTWVADKLSALRPLAAKAGEWIWNGGAWLVGGAGAVIQRLGLGAAAEFLAGLSLGGWLLTAAAVVTIVGGLAYAGTKLLNPPPEEKKAVLSEPADQAVPAEQAVQQAPAGEPQSSDAATLTDPSSVDTPSGATPQTQSSGGSRGASSSQAPADNVQAPTGTSDVSRNGTQLASNPSSSDSSGSSPSGDSGGDTPDPGLVPKSLDPDSSGSDGGGGGGGGTGGATDAAAPNPPPPDGMGTGPHTASLPHNQGGTGSSGEPVNTPAQPPASSLWTPNQQPVPTG